MVRTRVTKPPLALEHPHAARLARPRTAVAPVLASRAGEEGAQQLATVITGRKVSRAPTAPAFTLGPNEEPVDVLTARVTGAHLRLRVVLRVRGFRGRHEATDADGGVFARVAPLRYVILAGVRWWDKLAIIRGVRELFS